MNAKPIELEKLAQMLWDARLSAEPCEALTSLAPTISLNDAYAISDLNMRRRTGQGNAQLVGKKIGLTSRAVQKQLSVPEPDYGYLSSDMRFSSGADIETKKLILPRVEGEVAFVLKTDLRGPNISAEDVIAATDYILPSIEIIDSRVRDWKIKIQDTVADNASSAAFVLGKNPIKLDSVDLRLAGMALRVNGEVLSTGAGAACLDHPVLAVAWLANKMNSLGAPLLAGEVILSGAFGPIVPVNAGDHVEVAISGLGSVSCRFI